MTVLIPSDNVDLPVEERYAVGATWNTHVPERDQRVRCPVELEDLSAFIHRRVLECPAGYEELARWNRNRLVE